MNLSKKQTLHLRSLAHSLKPVVLLGANGLTEGVIAEIEQALSHHELMKVKIPTDDRELKQKIVEAIIRETKAAQVQMMGHTLTLYRPSDNNKITLPKI